MSMEVDLNRHLQERLINRPWIEACLGGEAQAFPHALDPSGEGQVVYNQLQYPAAQVAQAPVGDPKSPAFIINIPDGRYPGSVGDAKYGKMLESIKACMGLGAVVIGTNQMASIDPQVNRDFCVMVLQTPSVPGVAAYRVGFFWKPRYVAKTKGVYPVLKAFMLLKCLGADRPDRAEQVRRIVENRSAIGKQVPFQRIRELILKSQLTRDFANRFPKETLVYLTVMDSDFRSLQCESGEGVFDRIRRSIVMTNPQTAIGCAYRAADSERPLVKRAIRIDMVVRAATIQHIPYGAYLPEPLLCVLLKRPDAADNLKDLSFVGAGQALESRRLVENGRGRGVLTDNMTFIPDGLVTETSAWQVGKNCGRRDISSIKQKWVLQALRGLRQSHAHPKKWADQVYAALPFSCSQVTDATMPIMHIFGVYDPISRMFAEHGRFSAKVFDRVLANYALPLSAGQQNTVGTSMTRLLQLGMPRAQVDQIVWAAAAAGRAISAELLRAY